MKPFLVACILLLGHLIACSQNLVVNGGFEDENICTEYNQNCAPEGWIATSLYANYYFDATLNGAAKAHQGIHFIGLTAGNISVPDIRNFIRTRLLCALRKGHQYRLEFYVRSLHPILDSIGVYFYAQDFLYEKLSFKLITPQLWLVNGFNTTGLPASVWQKVQLMYTADGSEGYLTIGHFKRNDYTGIQQGEYRNDYYIFFDDVSLVPVDANEKICLQADSVRKEIYSENERHSYLRRKVFVYRRNPPPVKPLPKTQVPEVQQIDTLIIPDIFFATASYQLNAASFQLLDSFAGKIRTAIIDSMIIEGHTDSIGKLGYNEALSLNRAESVKNYLSRKVAGLAEKTVTRGYAFLRPVASNSTPKGRQMNRRVEIFLYKKEGRE